MIMDDNDDDVGTKFRLLYVYVYAVVPIGDHCSYFLDDRFQLFTAIFKSDGSDLQYGKTF